MRSLLVVLCCAVAGVSACRGDRPTFGLPPTSPSEPDAGAASGDASDSTLTGSNTEPTAGHSDETDAGTASDNPQTSTGDDTDINDNSCAADSGVCVSQDKADLGHLCESAAECGSGHCAASEEGDRICCATACDDLCSVCSASGECNKPADGAECPDIECPDSSSCVTYPTEPNSDRCEALGQCATQALRCVPEFEPEGEPCGDGMVCDGQGLCLQDCPKETGRERICTSACPCAVGAGVCTNDDQCEGDLVCTADAAAKLGLPAASCLPAHCSNDIQDAEETSVDCGGACGCRATYEIIEMTGIPPDAYAASLSAMNGDGSVFAGHISRGRGVFYPARIGADGVVTELQGFGQPGNTHDISADGSVIVGALPCEDPPTCTSFGQRSYRWTGNADPEALYDTGPGGAASDGRAVSATGAIAAGNYRSADGQTDAVFRITSAQSRLITALDWVAAISADGLFIAGRLATADQGAVWSHQQDALVPLEPPAAWTHWNITAMNADGSVFVGHGNTTETSFWYIWRAGEFNDLPQLPGADYTHPYAMSASGTVVTGVSGTTNNQRAFIWDEDQGTRRVVDEAKARGLELPVDLELANAEFVSDDGRTVVGPLLGATTPSFWRVTLRD